MGVIRMEGIEGVNIIDRGDEERTYYRPEILFNPSSHRNEIIKDYALVLGMPNPFEPSKRRYILAGCYVHGNLAAVLSMSAPMIRQVNQRLGGELQFIFLTESHVLWRYVDNIEIVRFHVYDEGQNRWVSKE